MHLPVDVHRDPRPGDHHDHDPAVAGQLTKRSQPPASLRTADGRAIAETVHTGHSFWQRFVGLMGRRELPDGEGLYLPGTSSIHMLFMRFPIDAVFLGRAGEAGRRQVIAARHSLRPWRGVVWYVRGAEGVVELPAGTLSRHGVGVGDLVTLET